MQGIVFTYRKGKQSGKTRFIKTKKDFKTLLRKWGGVMLFSLTLVIGLTVGSLCSGNLSRETLKNLDFLFATNMPARLSGGAWGAFCAGFASDFLFLFSAFLMGLSLWGAAALPFIAFFRGFGVGVSAGYLIMTYGLKGLVFYISVLLPGIAVSCVALVYELGVSFAVFRSILRNVLGKTSGGLKETLARYFRSSLRYLVITFSASVIGSALWVGLAGLFF